MSCSDSPPSRQAPHRLNFRQSSAELEHPTRDAARHDLFAYIQGYYTPEQAEPQGAYFYCVINAIGLQGVGASNDSMDIARGILRARR